MHFRQHKSETSVFLSTENIYEVKSYKRRSFIYECLCIFTVWDSSAFLLLLVAYVELGWNHQGSAPLLDLTSPFLGLGKGALSTTVLSSQEIIYMVPSFCWTNPFFFLKVFLSFSASVTYQGFLRYSVTGERSHWMNAFDLFQETHKLGFMLIELEFCSWQQCAQLKKYNLQPPLWLRVIIWPNPK